MSSLIYVHIGSIQNNYLIDSIYQTILFNHNLAIYIILSDSLIEDFQTNLNKTIIDQKNIQIIKQTSLDLYLKTDKNYLDYIFYFKKKNLQKFRDSFWFSTTCRFFYINALLQTLVSLKEPLIHIENDVMIYKNLLENELKLSDTSRFANKNSIYMAKDSPNRVIPSIMFYNSKEASSSLTEHITNLTKNSEEFQNDMSILAKYPHLIQLDLDPKSSNNIYDAACIGQTLFGIDPRNINENPDPLTILDNPTKGFINETCFFKVSDYKISKKFTDGLKYYIINHTNDVIADKPINNLHIHSKQLYQASSIYDIAYKDIITGDRICELCDIIITRPDINQFHKNIDHLNNKKLIIGCHFNNISDNDILNINKMFLNYSNKKKIKIFIYTHMLSDVVKYIFNNPKFDKGSLKFIIYLHNSDHSLDSLAGLEFVDKIYSQNPNIPLNNQVKLLPIGIANSMWAHGNLIDLYTISSKSYLLKKTNNLYINFSKETYILREKWLNECLELGLRTNSNKPFKEYLEELGSCYFSFCPRGNGEDCHRIWESLYVGTIPVLIGSSKNFMKMLEVLGIPFIEISAISELLELDRLALVRYNDFIKKYGSLYNLQQLHINYYFE